MHVRTIIILGLALAAVLVTAALVVHVKREHEFTAAISYVHWLTKSLQSYVQDHGQFPDSLDELRRDQSLDSNLLTPPFGSTVQYHRPFTNAPESTPILIMTYANSKVVVTKDFTRRP